MDSKYRKLIKVATYKSMKLSSTESVLSQYVGHTVKMSISQDIKNQCLSNKDLNSELLPYV